jgi:hypothetical protein
MGMRNLKTGLFLLTASATALALFHSETGWADDGGFDCSVFAAPKSADTIKTDTGLNHWLEDNHAGCSSSPSDNQKCLAGPSTLAKVGTFGVQTVGGGLTFTSADGSQRVFGFAASDLNPPGDPVEAPNTVWYKSAINSAVSKTKHLTDSDSVYGECQPILPGADNNTTFSCYDAGQWSDSVITFPNGFTRSPVRGAVLPVGIPNGTHVYTLGESPNNRLTAAPSSDSSDTPIPLKTILFAGKDCGKIARTNAWIPRALCTATFESQTCVNSQTELQTTKDRAQQVSDFLKNLMGAPPTTSASLILNQTPGTYLGHEGAGAFGEGAGVRGTTGAGQLNL